MTEPTVGVGVVATRHSTSLERCVHAVKQQADEVVTIVDLDRNLSEARNAATEHLATDVYAFIDADAYPADGWVSELRKGYADGALAVGGPAHPPQATCLGAIPDGWEWLVGIGPFHDEVREVRNTYGCNYSIRADIFDRLGGFDESLGKGSPVPHGEETDLARRMYERFGERMQYRPEAIVYHDIDADQLTTRALLKRAFDQGYTKAMMGHDSDETEFVRERLLGARPFEVALLGSAGLGALKGWLHG